mmetsp:Transcript_98234/g.277788  ORF Transcript_98234/g.277788 Transcript_98234/m.277788 type:complete len:254 (-) Transcript_98234:783-1544(-)
MSSMKASCSPFRNSMASATDLSSALIPACRASMSLFAAVTPSSATAMAASESEMARSMLFFVSSEESNSATQYAFLPLSSFCSFFRMPTISSIMLTTFSKPATLPRKASAMKSSWGRASFDDLRARCTAASARARTEAAVTRTWIKMAAALGRVFLKTSRASSSFRILIVSASAASSSLRSLTTASHSDVFVPQFLVRSAMRFLSSSNVASVSESSSFKVAIATASSPARAIFFSTEAPSAATSFFLAAISPS